MKYFITANFIFFLSFSVHSNEVLLSVNNSSLGSKEINEEYSFFLAGHIYGAPSPSAYPAASFLGAVDEIKNSNAHFLVLLGDTIQHMGGSLGNTEIEIFDRLVAKEINMPIYNTPGNHDWLSDPEKYSKYFGEDTYRYFDYGSESFFLLNSEEGNPSCNLSIEQQNFILNNVISVSESNKIKNVFFLMHQPLWAIHNKTVNIIDPWTNGGPHNELCTSFEEKIFPKILELAKIKEVYLIAGDLGCKNFKRGKIPIDSFPLFYHHDKMSRIKYVGSGICEHENDNILRVFIDSNSQVYIQPISLSGSNLNNIEEYNIEYWSDIFKNDEPKIIVKPKSSFAKIIDILKRKSFYLGFASSFILMFGLYVLARLKKLYRKNSNI